MDAFSSFSPSISLQSALISIAGKVKKNQEYVFEIRREHILRDCLRNVSTYDFSPTKCIKVITLMQGLQTINFNYDLVKVIFIGEQGEDGGGPRRKIWSLFALALKGSYFEGNEDSMVVRHDTMTLQVSAESEIVSC